MLPAVPPPPGLLRPVSVKLKPGWAFDVKARQFRGPGGEAFTPEGLPRGTRLEPTVPQLAGRPRKTLSAAERDLQRYVQVVLPTGNDPEAYVQAIRAWPCAASATAAPAVSLPEAPAPPRKVR